MNSFILPNSSITAPDSLRMLNEKQTAEALGLSVALLRKHRSKGTGCPYVKIGRRVLYRSQDINAFVASCTIRGKN